jgi:hypothetical protein
VRLAYELRLHFIDTSDVDLDSEASKIQWSANEERRRAWWAIWELDTFAIMVKRCLIGIDCYYNKTLLSVKNEIWFTQKYQCSCYLAQRPTDRWKVFRESGSEPPPKTWYIVVNSLILDAQSLPSQGVETEVKLTLGLPSSTVRSRGRSLNKHEISEKLSILSHTLHCFRRTLP